MTDDDGLDELLAGWAASVRLTDADADEIRQAVVAQPVGLDTTWWRDFSKQISGVMVSASRAGRAGWPAMAPTFG